MRSSACISKNTGKQVTTDGIVSDGGRTLRLMPSDEECVYQSGGSYSKPNGYGGPDAPARALATEPDAHVSTRPQELDADVVKFQNNREKWIAFVGLLNGRPYEIFTGLADDEEGIMLPKTVEKGSIIKSYDSDGRKHYDFQFKNKRGFKMTLEGLDSKFEPEYWNYAKLISGVLRYGMPITQVIKLVQEMELNNESINTWKNGVARALKKYLPNGTEVKGQECPNCGSETLVYQEGCLLCANCGATECG